MQKKLEEQQDAARKAFSQLAVAFGLLGSRRFQRRLPFFVLSIQVSTYKLGPLRERH